MPPSVKMYLENESHRRLSDMFERVWWGEDHVAKFSPLSKLRSGTGLGPGGTPQMVAIDSKIEQAMDLVKTHLMFAVREEVEVLRAKIIELETTVLQLEAENAVLREHVPADILSKLSLQGNPGGPTAAAAV